METIRPARVLIVDDERDIRDGSERILGRVGYAVVKAGQGREALAHMASEPADVVLLDLKMPGLDGMEVLDLIKGQYPETLVIIVTGFATIETAIEAMRRGAYDFITKPFRPDQLRLVVGRAVEHIRLREERDRLSAERDAGLWAITTEKSRLKTVIDSIIPGLIITELDKRVVMCNPSLNQMMGFGPEGIAGTSLDDHEPLRPVGEMADELLAGLPVMERELTREFVLAGDRPRYIRATLNGVLDKNGNLLGLVAVLRDITHIKELEREKSAFVAMLTHELRSPIGAVDTQLHVILKGLAGDLTEKQQDMLGRIKKRLGGVLTMINDLLDLSKIEARQLVQEKELTDLGPIVEEVVDLLRAQAEEKGLVFETDLSPLPPIMADPAAIKDMVVNLVANAVRYTPEGGRIRVQTESDKEGVTLTVADTGLGIPKDYHDKIFDRFFRVKDARTRNVTGTGLGLPIVKAIVEDHQGRVWLESEPDRGSTFFVRLPVVA
ncbi:MAG: response regulator [Proteobacteria bacterium]|nr:response regulator [Pseudomonadota bacterium]